jgi:ethanolaminephosphotransferase
MDDVVRQIYSDIERLSHHQNTLFVLAGDHGMTENGNHGGDTAAEIASALVFISPKFKALEKTLPNTHPHSSEFKYYSVVDQVDLVPTLSTLLGVSIPAGSVGVYIDELLALFPRVGDQMGVLMRNAQQMINLLRLKYNLEMPTDLGPCDATCLCGSDRVRRILCLWERFNFREPGTARSKDNEMQDDVQLLKEVSKPGVD